MTIFINYLLILLEEEEKAGLLTLSSLDGFDWRHLSPQSSDRVIDRERLGGVVERGGEGLRRRSHITTRGDSWSLKRYTT